MVAQSNKLCNIVTTDQLVGAQRSAIVRCADFLLVFVVIDQHEISTQYYVMRLFIDNVNVG